MFDAEVVFQTIFTGIQPGHARDIIRCKIAPTSTIGAIWRLGQKVLGKHGRGRPHHLCNTICTRNLQDGRFGQETCNLVKGINIIERRIGKTQEITHCFGDGSLDVQHAKCGIK